MQNKIIDARIPEIFEHMRKIVRMAANLQEPSMTPEQVNTGLAASRRASGQEMEVQMTPLMKHSLEHYDNFAPKTRDEQGNVIKQGDRLLVGDAITRAEKTIVSNMKKLLYRFNGSSAEYDDTLPLFDKRHYDVQCWQNLKDNLRFIVPGQAEERREMIKKYTVPTKLTVEALISRILKDPLLQKAIVMILDMMPYVRASDNIVEINLPFQTKHTGVGALWWKNDRTVDPETGKTYGEITMEMAEKLKDHPEEWDKWNISTAYGRDQTKGRLLIAVARVLNLLLNQLEGVEIPTYKTKFSCFVGYQDDEALKQALITMGEECEKMGLKCANEDYHRFDSTVASAVLALVGALSIMKANGSRSKQIALKRAVYAQRTWLVNGLDGRVDEIYGRIFSGFIDTNRGGGLCNLIMMTFEMMKLDPKYSSLVYSMTYYMLVMGDDNLHVYKDQPGFRNKLSKSIKADFGCEINEDKYEFGPMFLQYRVFKDPVTKDYVMAYAWTRVVRSMLMKETSKGLGPVGWTYAFYQQLFKLYEFKEAFTIAVNLLIVFDENKFFMDTPIPKLNQMLKDEDNKARAEATTDAQKRRVSTTWDRLADGDPSKARFTEENAGLLEKIQAKIREVYDPNFYNKYGLNY